MGRRICKCWCFLPLILLFFSIAGLFACYGIAVAFKHVDLRRWPFISDLGGEAPEGNVFAMILNWYAAGQGVLVLVFYKLVETRTRESRLNKTALAFGIATSIGISIAGCFEWTKILWVHLVGAALAFGGGVAYSWLVIIIGWLYFRGKPYPDLFSHFRTAVASVQTLCLIIFVVTFFLKERPELRTTATIAEWVLMFSQTTFNSTLAYDFKRLRTISLKLDGTREHFSQNSSRSNDDKPRSASTEHGLDADPESAHSNGLREIPAPAGFQLAYTNSYTTEEIITDGEEVQQGDAE